MFHLPTEIIKLIFEFEPIYINEYNKVLQYLKRLPAYIDCEPKHSLSSYVYFFDIGCFRPFRDINLPLHRVGYGLPPSKYHFQLLRNSNSLYAYAKYKSYYNTLIQEIKFFFNLKFKRMLLCNNNEP